MDKEALNSLASMYHVALVRSIECVFFCWNYWHHTGKPLIVWDARVSLWNFDGANYSSGFSFMTKATKSSILGLKHIWMMHIWFFNLKDHWTIFAWLVSMLKRKQQACAKPIDNLEHQCNMYGTGTPHARRQCLDMLQSPCCRRPSPMKQSWCADASDRHLIWRSGILSYLYLWFIMNAFDKKLCSC